MNIIASRRVGWRWSFLLVSCCWVFGCSTANRHPEKLDPNDPFSDPFFQEVSDGLEAKAQQIAQTQESLPDAVQQAIGDGSDSFVQDDDDDKPKSFLEKSSNALFSIFLVGLTLAKLVALPLLGV